MKKILIISEAGDASSSGIVRGLIYQPYFEEDGFETLFLSRVSPRLIRFLNSYQRLLNRLFLFLLFMKLIEFVAWCTEKYIVKVASRFDIIYLNKITCFNLVSKIRSQTKARIVADIGDAVWLPRYRSGSLDQMLQLVNAVTTDNEITASYLGTMNGDCTVIPDCPQVEVFDRYRGVLAKQQGKTVIGWVGSQHTVHNLYVIWEALEILFAKYDNLHLRLVGTGTNYERLPPFDNIDYSVVPFYTQETMVKEVMAMDIGVFPLQNITSSIVRGVLKATIYMAGEVPVVASPVGQLNTFIVDGQNGFLSSSTDQWVSNISALINDISLRKRIAATALTQVRNEFGTRQSYNRLKKILLNGEPCVY
jgi:glycosyltransferase involved in cell wall biosynthesis